MPNQLDHQGLVLSADLKQRFKWTIQLHERFVDAVIQLGGADKATPKSVMRLMGVPGLTLYHLKSHLQKYRLAKNGNTSTANDDKKQVEADDTVVGSRTRADKSPLQLNGTMMQIQVDAQQKLQVQIEVQKHLQLKKEAQGKYLPSVLINAHETLAGYCLSSLREEGGRTELSENTGSLRKTYSHGSFISEKTQDADHPFDA